jgi:hypothetical protein
MEPRNANVENPAILPVVALQPVFHPEFLSSIERCSVSVKACLKIFGVNTLRPAVAQLFLHGAPAEFQPRLVEVCAEFVGTGYPDHRRCSVSDELKTLLAFLQGPLELCEFVSVHVYRPLT